MFYHAIFGLKLLDQRFYLGQRYQLGGQVYRVYRRDFKTLVYLARICKAYVAERSHTWLLAFRKELRFIKQSQPAAVLSFAAYAMLRSLDSTSSDYARIALWLRSFCHSKAGVGELLRAALCQPSERQLMVAATFQKIGAWAQQRELLAVLNLSPAELERATVSRRRAFADRLEQFAKNVTSAQAHLEPGRAREFSQEKSPLFIASSNSMVGKPAKPLWLIRLVLDRVGLLVSAKQSADRMPRESTNEPS